MCSIRQRRVIIYLEEMRKRGGCFIRDQQSFQPSPWMLQLWVSPTAGPRGDGEPCGFSPLFTPQTTKNPHVLHLQSIQLLTEILFHE